MHGYLAIWLYGPRKYQTIVILYEQDTILEANRVMLMQKIEVEVHSDQ